VVEEIELIRGVQFPLPLLTGKKPLNAKKGG